MNLAFLDHDTPEFERYELREPGVGPLTWSRRDFFRISGSGVIVALLLNDPLSAQPPKQKGGRGASGPREIAAWIHIGENNDITVYTGKVEIGQNIRTSLTQVVAQELHTPVSAIQLKMADTAAVPFDAGTFGSSTTPRMASQLRRAAATARETLLDLAAEKAQRDRGQFSVADGKIAGPKGEPSYTFGQLTRGQKLLKLIEDQFPTASPDQWTIAGSSQPKVDGKLFVTGAHAFASDTRRPGMLYGKVLRPSAFKAKLTSVDTKELSSRPETTLVKEGEFIGVTAPTEFSAEEALAAIKATWEVPPQPSSQELFQHLKAQATASGGGGAGRRGGGRGGSAQGSVADGLKAAQHRLQETYTVAYIAHCPLEPRTAVAEWNDGQLTVWTGTQRPFGVRTELANALKLPPEKVRVIVPDMGSGYGGKHTGEAAVEAARLAKVAGKPVKITWTREEEFTWAYFRPAGVIEVTAGIGSDGIVTAWEFHNYNSGGSALETPYAIANRRTVFHPSDSPLRQGSYRGLAATANTFARECAMDELAHAAKLDPLEFRLKNLREPRLRAVLESAARSFDWPKKPTGGRGYGIACGTEKGGFVATAVEISVEKEAAEPRVLRAATAFECGAIVNPDHLKNQIEGAIIMGLGGALFERIDFADGKIRNPAFSSYRVPCFRDTPHLETILVDRKDLPSAGAGETPIIAIAPAIGNALFQATGKRIRSLPLT